MNGTGLPSFLLDTNVFIEAFKKYYTFDICPGFWDCLVHYHSKKQIFSIDRISDEIGRGEDKLCKWIEDMKQQESFVFNSSEEKEVGDIYRDIILWVENNSQFNESAKNKFKDCADGWLIAYAKKYKHHIVTEEQFSKDVKARVPIPNVCKQFEVPCVDTFSMLESLKVKFIFTMPKI